MFEPVLVGVVAAGVIVLHRHLSLWTSSWDLSPSLGILGIAFLALYLQRWVANRKDGTWHYDGLADLFVNIHSPYHPDSASRWGAHGLISFLLSVFGVATGPEGGALEWIQALKMRFRPRSSRWFEQRRRTDASSSVSAAVSASFGAPFSGVLIPMELGMGGRTMPTVISALTAFLAVRLLLDWSVLASFDFNRGMATFHLFDWKQWLVVLLIALVGGLLGTFSVRFFRYAEEGLTHFTQRSLKARLMFRLLSGAVLLALAAMVSRHGFFLSGKFLEEVFWLKHSVSEVALVFCVKLFSLAIVLAVFGTAGIFFSLFTLGGLFGFCLAQWVVPEVADFSTTAGMLGGAAILGAVLNVPVSGAVLAYELTGNFSILLPCLVASVGSQLFRRFLSTRSLIEQDLHLRSIHLMDGKTQKILESIKAGDAMATDFDVANESDSVTELYKKVRYAKYPFLPVVSSKGEFLGLLTVDIIQDGYQAQMATSSGGVSPLSALLEAKDLLYRSKSRLQTRFVLATDSLATTTGIFNEAPCAPVLGDKKELLGLLFVYHVRVAYDRETLRRSAITEAG